MNTSGDRLKALLHECDLSAADFAAHRNLTPQHINNWFVRGIPAARVDEIAELLSVCASWLRTGKGSKYPNPVNQLNHRIDTRTEPRSAPEAPPGNASFRPTDLSASQPNDILIGFHQAVNGHFLPLENHYLRLPRVALDKLDVNFQHAAALLMPDNSMVDRLQPGSPMAIDRALNHIIDGQPYALLHQGVLRVRYLYRLPGGGLRMRCQNFIEYPDEVISAEMSGPEHVEVLGWLFWHSTLSVRRPR
jgi:phage repressor protein C with HTH and peptisase S24 domain